MSGKAPLTQRPLGIRLLAILCAVFGVQSLATSVRLFPLWLAAAKLHHYGSVSFTWVGLLGAASGFSAAYALWRGRRWALLPFVVSAVLVITTIAFITMFGVGEIGGEWAWLMVVLIMLVPIVIAVWLIWYVWRAMRAM